MGDTESPSERAPWAPQICTAAIACPVCHAAPGDRCATDRPVHLERWDAWAANGYPAQHVTAPEAPYG